jgi:hypothetical protein
MPDLVVAFRKPRILFVSDAAYALVRRGLPSVPGATLFKFGGSVGLSGGSCAVKLVELTPELLAKNDEWLTPHVLVDGESVARLFADPERLSVSGTATLYRYHFSYPEPDAVPFLSVTPEVAAVLRERFGIGEKLRRGEWVLD